MSARTRRTYRIDPHQTILDDEQQQALLDDALRERACGALSEAYEALWKSQLNWLLPWFEARLPVGLQSTLGAEDLAQDAFLLTWVAFARFEGRVIAQYRSWLLGVCQHRLASLKRGHASRGRAVGHKITFDEALIGRDTWLSCVRATIAKELRADRLERLELALAELPADERWIVMAHDLQRQTYDEIARHLHCARSTACDTYRRALAMLTRRLASER